MRLAEGEGAGARGSRTRREDRGSRDREKSCKRDSSSSTERRKREEVGAEEELAEEDEVEEAVSDGSDEVKPKSKGESRGCPFLPLLRTAPPGVMCVIASWI